SGCDIRDRHPCQESWLMQRRVWCGAWLILSALWLGIGAGRLSGADKLATDIAAVLEAPEFKTAHWGMLVIDLQSGAVVHELNADRLFAPASVTKLFSVATALDAFGPDHRFETPVYARGEVNAAGELLGDLILVASGDLTLGGRTTPEGQIAFTSSDHTYA